MPSDVPSRTTAAFEPHGQAAETPAEAGAGDDLRLRGACHVIYAFDVGFHLDLPAAEQMLADHVDATHLEQRWQGPSWAERKAQPLRLRLPGEQHEVGRFATSPSVQCTLFDFGAASIVFHIPLDNDPADLPVLSESLYDNRGLADAARGMVDGLLEQLGPVPERRHPAPIIEDYVVFAFDRWTPALPAEALIDRHRQTFAALLSAETNPLSEQQARDCVASRLSYGEDDATIAHWNGAILLDPRPFDTLSLLEHANVLLVELRHVDHQLDELLTWSRDMMNRLSRYSLWPLTPGSRDVQRLARAQMNSAMLFEAANNSIKLVEDQYLARVYRLVAEKLQMPAWEQAVRRKIDIAESVFEKITHRQTTRRMEVLEIIIIILILVSVIMPFIPWLSY